MPGDKCTMVEAERRRGEILKMLLVGASRQDILRYAKKEKWNVGDRQVDTYINEAKAVAVQDLEKDREKNLAFHVRRNEMLLNKCLHIHDYKGALSVDKNIAELKNLYPNKLKVEHSGGIAVSLAELVKQAVENDKAGG